MYWQKHKHIISTLKWDHAFGQAAKQSEGRLWVGVHEALDKLRTRLELQKTKKGSSSAIFWGRFIKNSRLVGSCRIYYWSNTCWILFSMQPADPWAPQALWGCSRSSRSAPFKRAHRFGDRSDTLQSQSISLCDDFSPWILQLTNITCETIW